MAVIKNKSQTAEEQLASFIVNTDYESLPREVIEISKSAFLDLIGVALAGSSEPPTGVFLEELKESGGNPHAGVIGTGFRTSVTLAALINGTMAHALDYDDVSLDWNGHPSTVLVPAILALGEKNHSSGKEIITAYAVGFEVGAKLGIGIGNSIYGRGWHNTSVIGSVASAAAAVCLLKLGLEETQIALGIAASLSHGFRENFGTMTKPLHAGNAARNGTLTGLLAKRGFTASKQWLTADLGFGKVFAGDNKGLDEALSQLGKKFSMLSSGIWLKYYPSCAGTHSPIEAALKLRKQHSLNPDEIAEINCEVAPFLPRMLIQHHPKTGLEGKFSLEYSVSVALIDGEALFYQFTDERVSKPDVQAFIPKVKYQVVPELGTVTDLNVPVKISITLRNGKEVSISENKPTGKADNPMSPGQLRQKFDSCAHVLSQADRNRVVEMVSELEKADEIEKLMGLIVGGSN